MGIVSYYVYGLPTFLVIVIALYLLFTGQFTTSITIIRRLLTVDITSVQTPAKPSMLVVSSKSQVLTRGVQLV